MGQEQRAMNPEEIQIAREWVQAREEKSELHFGQMDDEQLIENAAGIFRVAEEVFPIVYPEYDEQLKKLLTTLVKGEAPKPFMGPETSIYWMSCWRELISRIAKVDTDAMSKKLYEGLDG